MKFQPPKGTRDLLPEDANKLQKIIEVCRDVFEKYGFEPLITPAFESFELLAAKGGLGEAVKDEIYYFKDKSNRELGLRFDLTMPLARVVTNNPQLLRPFKRYTIDKVWRYDNPQAMRWREFWQADIDIVGSASELSDAECVAAICEILDKLGFKEYFIRVNSRGYMRNLLEEYTYNSETAFEIIDKADKLGRGWIASELLKILKPDKNLDDLLDLIFSTKGKDLDTLIRKNAEKFRVDKGGEGIFDQTYFLKYCKVFGIDDRIFFDASLVRGLEYYTGLVFEVNLGIKASCGGGGRYDKLIENIGDTSDQSVMATGISLGLDRILEVMKENKMFKTEKSKTKVFVANVDNTVINDTLKTIQELRKNNINSQMDLMGRNLTKQLEYADSSDIPYVIIVGKKEVETGKFKLKDMNKKTERELTVEEIVKFLSFKNIINSDKNGLV